MDVSAFMCEMNAAYGFACIDEPRRSVVAARCSPAPSPVWKAAAGCRPA